MTHLPNAAAQAEKLFSSRTDQSVIETFNQQKALHRDTNDMISMFSQLQT